MLADIHIQSNKYDNANELLKRVLKYDKVRSILCAHTHTFSLLFASTRLRLLVILLTKLCLVVCSTFKLALSLSPIPKWKRFVIVFEGNKFHIFSVS